MIRIYLLLVIEHLRHRPIRALLTLVGVAIGVSAWLAIRVVNGEVYQSFEQSVESVVGEASVTITGASVGINEQILQTIQHYPGVELASPVLKIEGEILDGPMSGQPLFIWGIDLLEQGRDWETEDFSEGMEQKDWEQLFAPTTVFLEEELAFQLDLRQGQTLSVKVQEDVHQLVVGKVLKSSGLHGGMQQQVLMDIASAQWKFGWLGRLHHVEIVPDPQVTSKIKRLADMYH